MEVLWSVEIEVVGIKSTPDGFTRHGVLEVRAQEPWDNDDRVGWVLGAFRRSGVDAAEVSGFLARRVTTAEQNDVNEKQECQPRNSLLIRFNRQGVKSGLALT